MKTVIKPATTPGEIEAASRAALERWRSGDVVALPTETVYGLAAPAYEAVATRKIFRAKERPSHDPLIVHLPFREMLEEVAEIDPSQRESVEMLASRFWPGPLTMVLPRSELIPDEVTASLPTVAVRMSMHPLFSRLIRSFGAPLAAPSANRFGRLSPTTARDVEKELGGRIPLIIDGGECPIGIESTIVKLEADRWLILRPGPVTREQLQSVSPVPVVEGAKATDRPEVPGQLPSHYAPSKPLHTLEGFQPRPGVRYGLLYWEGKVDKSSFAAIEKWSPSGEMLEVARRFYRLLRFFDESDVDEIVVEAIPEIGVGRALMDRMRRALHSRPL